MQSFLQLNNVRKEYDSKVAVDNLCLGVPKGEIYGIIGPNGAGKTTTLRMIMNIISPDSGEILVDGQPMNQRLLERIGYLPEERGLYKKMTAREVILYMVALKGKNPSEVSSKIDGWLERMNLSEYADRKVEELSKGMAQKLQFITTILHDPDMIILDELFSGLDPVNIELIKSVLSDLKREGKTILFSTHVMEQAEKLCDYICMISGGKKVIDGRMADVRAQFGNNSIQIEIDGDGSFLSGLPGVLRSTQSNNYVELQLADGIESSTILKELVGRVSVRRFEVVEPSLYDIFIKVAQLVPGEAIDRRVTSNE